MSITFIHPDYQASAALWQGCRDVIAGSDTVKAAGTTYLPKLPDQEPAEYQAYKDRALFYNAAARTVDGLVGAIFRKPIQIEVPGLIEPFLKDITLKDEPLDSFSKNLLHEIMTVGRVGILVDMPPENSPDHRPYLTTYSAEQIRNWRTVKVDDLTLLSLVVLYEETWEASEKDKFELELKGQYRVLELSMECPRRVYQQTIWRKVKTAGKEEWVTGDPVIPIIRGDSWDFIPFVFLGPRSLSPNVERSPIADLVDVNISHYRSSADLEHGTHFTALPFVSITGWDSQGKNIDVGSSKALVISNENAKVNYVEFTGKGLETLEKALEKKEAKMAALGARLLEQQRATPEAAETVKLRHSGENSILQSIAQTGSMGLTMAVKWMADWAGANPDDVAIALNTDLMDVELSPQEVTALMALWQSNAISKQTLYSNLQKGELTRPGVDYETEEAQIKAGGSTGSGGL
jgi:hypothetical protein